MSAGSLSSTRPLVLADLAAHTRVRQVTLVAAYAGAIAVSAQVAIPLPFGPVPLTLQTLAVLCGAAALGPGRAIAGTGLYVGLGIVGVPWFAVSGGATAGYLVGFVLAAALVGHWARAGHDRTVRGTVAVMVAGNLVVYTMGVLGLMVVVGLGLQAAVVAGVLPFLVGDAAKIAVAAALLPAAWRLVDAADRS